MSRATQGTARLRLASDTGLSPATARLSRRFSSQDSCHVAALLPRRGRNLRGLGCAPFARHYWGYHCCFLFLRVLRCFSSPGSPQLSLCPAFSRAGCPIRVSADLLAFADPRGFSQLIAPFVASESLWHPPYALFRLAFTAATELNSSTSPTTVTRRFIMQKARRHIYNMLRPLVGAWFQGLFHSSCRSAFHLSLTVLVHYRSHGSI